MKRWGVEAWKLHNKPAPAYEHDALLAAFAASNASYFSAPAPPLVANTLLELFAARLAASPRPLAVSDFPVFAIPCALAARFPAARFITFTRDFDAWFRVSAHGPSKSSERPASP